MAAIESYVIPAMEPSAKAIELSFPLPKAPETKIHMRLTINTTSLLLFLTTVYGGDAPTAAPLGSFVYALPDVGSSLSKAYASNYRLILALIEEQRWANPFDTTLLERIVIRIHNSAGTPFGKQDKQAGVRW